MAWRLHAMAGDQNRRQFGKMRVYKEMQMHSQSRVDSVVDRRNLALA
jgi:hypothetical protein